MFASQARQPAAILSLNRTTRDFGTENSLGALTAFARLPAA
jgi:hypothetical protein